MFYSESADGLADHHVQCHNCGKQVDIVTAPSESQETIAGIAGVDRDDDDDDDEENDNDNAMERRSQRDDASAVAMVVKPPAGFGDSPDGPRSPSSRRATISVLAGGTNVGTSTRLYKKMDKRFRSEERHAGERRLYRHRQEATRAKSEERGKDSPADVPLRPAGSTPCVAQHPDGQHGQTAGCGDEEHGIYMAYYRFRRWVCVVDTAVVAKRDIGKI